MPKQKEQCTPNMLPSQTIRTCVRHMHTVCVYVYKGWFFVCVPSVNFCAQNSINLQFKNVLRGVKCMWWYGKLSCKHLDLVLLFNGS